jgi:hypothetical protein
VDILGPTPAVLSLALGRQLLVASKKGFLESKAVSNGVASQYSQCIKRFGRTPDSGSEQHGEPLRSKTILNIARNHLSARFVRQK